MRYRRIAVKIGSNVLTRQDGRLNLTRMSALVDQIAELHKKAVEIILISSGAVASGRSEIKAKGKLDSVSARQLYSAVGQAKLINRYYDFFKEHGIACGQVLTTKESLGTRRHYLNQKNCVGLMLENRVIPIMNENDTISVTELMFTDNDELSALVASMMNVDALIILSNIDGIYDGPPNDTRSKVIREINYSKSSQNEHGDISDFIQTSKSSFGRGGMLTKYNIARKLALEGIPVIIANGTSPNILPNLLQKDADVVCTHFLSSGKDTSNLKKWIAHSESFTKGEIYINQGAQEALLGEKARSLLAVGITAINGEFEKDDIVRIFDQNKVPIGLGKVSFNSLELSSLIGQKANKAVIHYNYLHISE
ncbi:glutamate 5-kinase [Bacteroidales bacterium]|nr:glutamate 5-kinase [Bacteroidales bacterium]